MSKEVLKTAYINFQAKGVQEIRTLITHLGRDLDKFSASIGQSQLKMASKLGDISNKIKESAKKANEAVLVGTKASTVALGKEVSALKLINKEFKGMAITSKELKSLGGRLSVRITQKSPELLKVEAAKEAAKIEEKAARDAAKEKLRAAKEAAREEKSAAREAAREARESERRRKDLSNRIASIAKFIKKGGVAFYNDYQRRNASRAENAVYDNLLAFSGISNSSARNFAANLAGYGGSTEGALGTLNALSAGIGGIARGDTGLLQVLGMYGIGGVSPRTSPTQLINKIRARIQRGDLSKNEINSLLSQLPLDDASKRAVMSSRMDLFSGELGEFNVAEENRQALRDNTFAIERLREATEVVNKTLAPVDSALAGFVKDLAFVFASVNSFGESIADLGNAITALGGYLGGKGLEKLLNKGTSPAKRFWDVAASWGLSSLKKIGGVFALGFTPTSLGDSTIEGNLHRLSPKEQEDFLREKYGDAYFDLLKKLNPLSLPQNSLSSIQNSNNTTTTNNYNIYYSQPQQDFTVPFYLAARNQNGRMWEEDALYYAPNY